MSMYGQGTKRHRNIAENFNLLSKAHERHRQTTDGPRTTYSERERSLKVTYSLKQSKVLNKIITSNTLHKSKMDS